jgi:hypothetical protein
MLSVGLTAFLVGGAGVAVATIALTSLGAALRALVRSSGSVALQQFGDTKGSARLRVWPGEPKSD